MWKTFLQKEMAFNGLDGILGTMYKRVFWVFYSKPALMLYPFAAAGGVSLFIYTVAKAKYPLLETGGNVFLGVLTFLVANMIMVVVPRTTLLSSGDTGRGVGVPTSGTAVSASSVARTSGVGDSPLTLVGVS